MEYLIDKLNSLPNSYFEFVDSTLSYAKEKPEHLSGLIELFENNNNITVSDVIYFISTQPDFLDDDVEEVSMRDSNILIV